MKKPKNRYIHHTHISTSKFREIISLFVQDLPASKIAILSKISRLTINKILMKIRRRLAKYCEQSSPLVGEVEVDESYFGGRE